MSPTKEIRIPPSLSYLGQVADLVMSLGRHEQLPPDTIYRLRLATDEIVTNIITHGYQENGGGKHDGDIVVCGGADPATVWVRVEDAAPPFDPSERIATAEVPTAPAAEREIGGLGLLLAARSLDDLRYEFVDGRNRNTLSIRRIGTKAW